MIASVVVTTVGGLLLYLILAHEFVSVASSESCPNLSTINVEVISVGNFYPTSISSFPYVAPALDVGLLALKRVFGCLVNFTHTYVYKMDYKFCDEITANVDDMVAHYYYRRNLLPNITAFIAPGKCTRTDFVLLNVCLYSEAASLVSHSWENRVR